MLLTEDALYRTRDGGYHLEQIKAPGPSMMKIQRAGPAVAILNRAAVFLSYDFGESWKRIDLPPLPENVSAHVMAVGNNLLAAADSRGRVYLKDPNRGDWSEWIVGPVHDLAYSGGLIYAVTAMATVAILDGGSVAHVKTDDLGNFSKFVCSDANLYVCGTRSLYRVNGRALDRESGPLELPESATQFALVSPREAVAVSMTDRGAKVYSIQLDRHEVRQISALP